MTEKKKIRQQVYKEKKNTKRYVFDLYLTDENEAAVAEILDEAKKAASLKQFIIEAVKEYDINR